MEAWKKAVACVVCSGLFVAGIPLPVAAQQAVPEQSVSSALKASSTVNNANEEKTNEARGSDGKIADGKITELPDSPGTTLSNSKQQSIQLAWGPVPSPSQSMQSQGTQAQPQPSPQKPVGTAVAEAPPSSGIAASQPAGVAVAPAKQRRVRTIVLRMGAIVGAGVAVGSVVALTAATSSKPPGAH
jgi:hypothetical protein